MTSINTNQSAMIALGTLRNITTELNRVNDQISTGKKVNNARDNAAVWAISTTMEADVMSFKTITDSLNLGAATVGVARSAAEQISTLLQDMKALATSAQEENVDRTKIQRDIVALRDQIDGITKGAQFNGLNLLQSGADVNLLASLNRAASGVVTSNSISVSRVDLSQTAGVTGAAIGSGVAGFTESVGGVTKTVAAGTPSSATPGTVTLTVEAAATSTEARTITVGSQTYTYNVTAGDTAATIATAIEAELAASDADLPPGVTVSRSGAVITLSNSSTVAITVTSDGGAATDGADGFVEVDAPGNATAGDETATLAAVVAANSVASTQTFTVTTGIVSAGDIFTLTIGDEAVNYRARGGETVDEVVEKLIARGSAIAPSTLALTATGGGNIISLANTGASAVTVQVTAFSGTAGGALEDLATIDVTSNAAAASALSDIEDALEVVIDAAASFGSAQKRIDIQNDFITSLVDSLKLGVSALVDANLEEAAARLTALQVQQQLGLQSLAIANAAPQTILALFQ